MNRLLQLHLRSRRVPLITLLIAILAGILRAAKPLTEGGSEFAGLLPLVLMVGCAALIAASARSPFGDPERATFPLPRLRLTHLLALVALAVAVVGAARVGDDPVAGMRDVAGLTGLALLTAPVIGAALAWIAPLAYAIYCGGPLDVHQVDLWSWPALPGTDGTAALIAVALLAAGVATVTAVGARDQRTDPQ